MKNILIVALLALGGYAIYKHKTSPAAKQNAQFRANVVTGNSEPAGVPFFSDILAPNRPDQLAAWAHSTPDSTVDSTYAPAFGAEENQPDGWSLAI